MKMMHGACALPCSKRSRTRDAPTPTNISTKSEPDIEKNGRPASPATARASSVLPVPGGPTSSAPVGRRPPSLVNFCGSLRNSMISCSSTFASSAPATSANVTLGVSPERSFAFDLPKLNALVPPDCIWRKRKIQKPMSRKYGRKLTSMPTSDGRGSCETTSTPLSSRASVDLSVFAYGSLVVNFFADLVLPLPSGRGNDAGILNSPVTLRSPLMMTRAMLSRSSCCRYWV
jgi:hypothetical protein